ncbi:MAG: glycosyltransferase [Candidatus Omnitrophica bacterium]|nr:glycosyltransferase [Candidatus Omnitrophota bacterium]
MKVAIVHDWLTGMRGGEKCLEVFCELFPEAPIYTLLHEEGSVSRTIENMDIRTSFLQKIPGISKKYRWFLPIFPLAIGSFDLSGYDLVISSSHCIAKGAKRSPDALHICYCYTPMRYAWEFFDDYFSKENLVKRYLISGVLNSLKRWDINSNKRVDYFVAISDNIKDRIKRHYNTDAEVIYPPVDIADVSYDNKKGDYYLIVSAFVPYKRIDLAIKAFNETKRKLIVVGDGPDRDNLRNSVLNENIEFPGWVDANSLKECYAGCKALIFPGEEDFGIVPVEAQSFGKPVIAYAKGGVLETVTPFLENKENATGVFFNEQTVGSLNKAIDIFENNEEKFIPLKIKDNAKRFNRNRFKREIQEYIRTKWVEHNMVHGG